jgi:hypothetical protein
MNDDERIAYLAGQDHPIDPEDRADLDELLELLGDATLWEEPPAGLEDRVAAAVADERAARSTTPAPTIETTAPARHRPWIAQRGWSLGAAAAAVVLILGVGTFFLARDTGGGGGQRFSSVLASPEGAPTASGRVVFEKTTSGWRLELNAPGLPRLDGGRFYQAWMRNADGVLVPVGTFNEGKDVVLWSGVSPVDYPMLTVTAEAADGDQASSGVRVLSGTATSGD